MTASPLLKTTVLDFLGQVLDVLQVPADDKSRMLAEVDFLVKERALLRLAEKLPKSEQQELLRDTEEFSPDEKAKIFSERLLAQVKQKQDLYTKALETAAEELVPEYVQSVAQSANEDQRQKIIQLAEATKL